MGIMQPPEEVITFEWSVNQEESDARQVAGYKVFNFHIPLGFSGLTLGIKNAHEQEGPYEPLFEDEGTAVSITVAAQESVAVTSSPIAMALASCSWIKLVSGDAEAVGTKVSCSKQT